MHAVTFYRTVWYNGEERDIPIATYNETTRKFEPVINNRGNAYAHRNDRKYRRIVDKN